jgi:hypothetical protein
LWVFYDGVLGRMMFVGKSIIGVVVVVALLRAAIPMNDAVLRGENPYRILKLFPNDTAATMSDSPKIKVIHRSDPPRVETAPR